jgi:heme oxygenase
MLCLTASLLATGLRAQDTKLQSGSLEFLKGQTTLNVEYVYDGLTVGKLTEQAYIEKKVSEYNAKETGSGDRWLAGWKNDRSRRYEPKFEELFNKQLEKKGGLKLSRNPDAPYTLVSRPSIWNPAGTLL